MFGQRCIKTKEGGRAALDGGKELSADMGNQNSQLTRLFVPCSLPASESRAVVDFP